MNDEIQPLYSLRYLANIQELEAAINSFINITNIKVVFDTTNLPSKG